MHTKKVLVGGFDLQSPVTYIQQLLFKLDLKHTLFY